MSSNINYKDELEEQIELEYLLIKQISQQMSMLEEVEEQRQEQKNMHKDIHQKNMYLNNLIESKQVQILNTHTLAQTVLSSNHIDDIYKYSLNQHNLNHQYLTQSTQRDTIRNSINQINLQIEYINQNEPFLQDIQEQQRQDILQLNEELLSLKGCIRVVCRVSPSIYSTETTIKVIDDQKLLLVEPAKSILQSDTISKNSVTEHEFMKVFDEQTTQHDIFNDLNFFLNSFIQGSHVCIFTYGPTGSGKTYTMFGNMKDKNKQGIIPRSIETLCLRLEEYERNGWQNTIGVSIVELYQQNTRDLIKNTNLGNKQEPFTSRLPERLDFNQKVEFLISEIQQANLNRTVRKTKCNNQSSRSHLIFTIKLNSTKGMSSFQGSLNLIDLAGSERLHLSETTGQGQKETIFINQSLQALSAVIKSIKKRDIHIPYRNSTLTQYLKNYLNNSSKTMIILNISSNPKYYPQTKDALNLLSTKSLQLSTNSLQSSPQQNLRNKEKSIESSTDTKICNQNKKQKILENKLNTLQTTQKKTSFF